MKNWCFFDQYLLYFKNGTKYGPSYNEIRIGTRMRSPYRMVPFPTTFHGHAIIRRLISLISLIPFFMLLLKTKGLSTLLGRITFGYLI